MRRVQVFPSILSADFGRLADEAKRLEDAGADGIHIDVMDGHFVPNLTLGPKAVAAINRNTDLFLDVHLMIYNPFDYIEQFVQAGADRVTFHFEATEDVEETLGYIRKCGKKAGLSFRPETSGSMILNWLPLSDLILVMTVNPGFGGQKFMPDMLEKVALVREFCKKNPGGCQDIQVDGGINAETARECVAAGANVLVSGDYVYKAKSLKEAIHALRGTP